MTSEDEQLLALIDGTYRSLRDDNHVESDRILVWDRERSPEIQSVSYVELTHRYQCGGIGAQWTPEDLGEIVKEKSALYRQSVVAHEISDEDPSASPTCGTVVLIINGDKSQPHRWNVIKSAIIPG